MFLKSYNKAKVKNKKNMVTKYGLSLLLAKSLGQTLI